MSFSSRLTTFFVLMVLVPILAIGVLGFRLIDQTTSGRAGARASGLLTAASSVYTADERAARSAAQAVAVAIARLPDSAVRTELARAAAGAGLIRVEVIRDGRQLAALGSRSAVAPGTVEIADGRHLTRVTASVTSARDFVTAVTGPLAAAQLSQGGRVLASSLAAPLPQPPPATLSAAGHQYETASTAGLSGFGTAPVRLTMLSDLSASSSSRTSSDLIALAFLGGFALLSFGFAVLASRGLNEMVKRFLAAATRLANRDFSVRVPVEGSDEFARLATEFNRMSDQLEDYIAALDAERRRLHDAIRRTGDTFASGRDRSQLEAITLETALSGVEGGFGRITRREDDDAPLAVTQTAGAWRDAGELIVAAEAEALNPGPFGEADAGEVHVMAARMGLTPRRQLAYGTLAIGRHGAPFTEEDRTLFRSLAAQAWRALDNVRLHDEADRKATTDLLTGLVNHGEFQAVLSREMEDGRRYGYPVGLILFDLDNFKSVNDTHGHLQGDAVLRAVARVLSGSIREGDTAARYGGEELALILPHTDLEGSYAIAERVRSQIAELVIPMVEGEATLQVTASVGVSALGGGPKEQLIAEADSALYTAKRTGKNRVVQAQRAIASTSTGSFSADKARDSG
ncbi:MAG TPA: diguanylate cyclase [Solirubrobacteraceae bacterium]|nr:diguanylate cyclase [Solirubrobacteraceae bacterium]